MKLVTRSERRDSLVASLATVAVLSCASAGHRSGNPATLAGMYRRAHTIDLVAAGGLEKATVTDVLNLSPESNGGLRFSFELQFNNGHSCRMEGVARPTDGFFEYREPLKEVTAQAGECVLRIRPTRRAITLEDVGRACAWTAGHCGVRGSIDGATFPRVK